MAIDEVQEVIERLRVGIDAAAVDLVERRFGQGAEQPPGLVAKSLAQLVCLSLQWREWFRALEAEGEKTQTCGCRERHQLHGTVLDQRWVLVMVARDLVVAEGSFAPTKALAYAEGVSVIGLLLEGSQSDRRAGSRGPSGGSPAELAMPLSWHRKTHG